MSSASNPTAAETHRILDAGRLAALRALAAMAVAQAGDIAAVASNIDRLVLSTTASKMVTRLQRVLAAIHDVVVLEVSTHVPQGEGPVKTDAECAATERARDVFRELLPAAKRLAAYAAENVERMGATDGQAVSHHRDALDVLAAVRAALVEDPTGPG